MNLNRRLAILTVASPRLGLGHLARSSVIVKSVADYNISCDLYVFGDNKFAGQYAQETSINSRPVIANSVLDAVKFIHCSHKRNTSKPLNLLLDIPFPMRGLDLKGWKFLSRYISEHGIRTTLFDGLGPECATANVAFDGIKVVVPYISSEKPPILNTTRNSVFLGPRFFPFDNRLIKLRDTKRHINNEVEKVFVCFGGGNTSAENQLVLEAMAKIKQTKFKARFCGAPINGINQDDRFEYLGFVKDIPQELRSCDLAILGSGLVRYEAALVGTPMIAFSRFQSHVQFVRDFAGAGLCIDGGHLQSLSQGRVFEVINGLFGARDLRYRLSQKCLQTFDEFGLERLAVDVLGFSLPNY